jgi:Ni,Fe-hydrogenase III large subunit
MSLAVDQTQTSTVTPERFAERAHELAAAHDARLADLFAQLEGEQVVLRAVYALDRDGRYEVLSCPISGHRSPPLSEFDPAAFVEECEIFERFAVRPDNHQRLNRVLLPPHMESLFPRERPATDGQGRLRRELEPHVVQGEAFEFPFGPVRAAGWESLYMGLVTTGEEVLDLYLFHWHKHRGIERRLASLDCERATFYAERAEGLSAVGVGLAFCRALERASATEVPPQAAAARAIALELERIYNHAQAIAISCQATGLSVGQARAEIALELLLRANLAAFGHRYLFGVLCPGGVRRGPDPQALRAQLPAALGELRGVTEALLKTNSHVDRLEATGIVTPEQAQRLALVGPVARASGQDIDCRRDHPAVGADQLLAEVPVRAGGDALARMEVMLAEVEGSARLIEALLGEAGPGRAELGETAGSALGWAESARGEALAWVSLAPGGRVAAARLRPASLRNWRAFDDAARSQNVFTDIPIIEASFWLTVAGFAR